MSAGKPNFQKLYEMGKLPKDQYHQIPGLLEREKQKEKTENNPEGMKCQVEGCEYVAKGSIAQQKSRITLHSKSHETKETK